MEVSNVIILAIALLIFLAFTVFVMEMFVPLQMQLSVHEICRPYLYVLEAEGHLSPETLTSIERHVSNIGLSSVSIVIEESGKKFGDKMIFRMTASYVHEPMVALFKRRKEVLEFNYEKKVSVRKIVN